ncbi:AraC family transcriptional regulator [Rhodocytophaga aerolata]|uniref:AraC family transcriptional regulator n=1 Tax=Rhodocytophaga aerolata TaxID=455078 RepID=A0ABT8R678_9BACT|nr:AraC family transcriptional regulator [Rhodocytophaga aerolata]MDO1447161.1 AraC family transcriptional regulator [Rhodocytophaga aerolata]
MAKKVPVLQINNFQQVAAILPNVYVQRMEEHLAQYQFIKTPHRHDFYCIFLFTQGTGTHIIDFKTYEVTPGSVFFMSPAQMHTFQLSADTDGYVVFFTPELYLLENTRHTLAHFPFFHYTASPCMVLNGNIRTAVTEIVIRIYQEYRGNEPHKQAIISSYLNILLIKLSNQYSQVNHPSLSSHLLHQIRQLESLIEKHYLAHKPAGEYAELMNISQKQLNTICQTALSKPLSTILQERIILEAKRLLVHTHLTIAQISAQLNFTDNSYFTRFFKKNAGLTPEQFRQQFQ